MAIETFGILAGIASRPVLRVLPGPSSSENGYIWKVFPATDTRQREVAPAVMLVPMQRSRVRAFLPVLAAAAVCGAFIALNHAAFRGYFQDDELDTLKWAPSRPLSLFLLRLADPCFDPGNFRPVGHLFFHLMGRGFGLNFPPYIVPVFAFHLINALLLYLILRKLEIGQWCAIAAAAFFCLSASAFDAYWKPMYVFDLLCTALCLASILCFSGSAQESDEREAGVDLARCRISVNSAVCGTVT